MAGSVSFARATEAHAEQLAGVLRPEDLEEVKAFGHPDARTALLVSLRDSEVAWAGLAPSCCSDEVACMFGVIRLNQTALGDGGHRLIWFLTGRAFGYHPMKFARAARAVVPALLQDYRTLGNYIDARYTAAVRWARWLGFRVGEPVPFGPHGQLFHPATIRRT